MFWGLILEPGKRYAQRVKESFHVSGATLDLSGDTGNNVSVKLDMDNQEFLLCNLSKQRDVQCTLDLNFQSGDEIAFFTSGKGTVHLTGYLVPEEDIMAGEDSEDEDEDEVPSPVPIQAKPLDKSLIKRKSDLLVEEEKKNLKKPKLTSTPISQTVEGDSDEDDDSVEIDDEEESEEEEDEESEDEDEDEDEDESDEEEISVSPSKLYSPDTKSPGKPGTPGSKKKEKQKFQDIKNDSKGGGTPKEKGGKSPKTPAGTPTNLQNGTPGQKKDKKSDLNVSKGTPKPQTPGAGDTPQKRLLKGGVGIEDLKMGNGLVAKPGSTVTVYYVGRLKQSNKQFDATQQGPGFKFRLGQNNVIKGWDIGVAGMKVGGTRRIVCPPHMAYGKQGSPPVIPPNSTLVFEVELRGVN